MELSRYLDKKKNKEFTEPRRDELEYEKEFEKRTFSLERFYFEHDGDSRAVDFQKLAVKLRHFIKKHFHSALHSTPVSGKKRVKPIYDWESRPPSSSRERDKTRTPEGSCLRVRLTEEEYQLLTLKRGELIRSQDITREHHRHSHSPSQSFDVSHMSLGTLERDKVKMKGGGPELDLRLSFLNASSPYIDSSARDRLLDSRRKRPDKWVAKTDFVVTKPKHEKEKEKDLPEFINAGLMFHDTSDVSFFRNLRSDAVTNTDKKRKHHRRPNMTSLLIHILHH